jgi:hypothetical protein
MPSALRQLLGPPVHRLAVYTKAAGHFRLVHALS